MLQHKPGGVRREQKKSLYKKEISRLFHHLVEDYSELSSLVVTRVDISADSGICYVFFTSFGGREQFEKALEKLKLFKSSLRSAFGRAIQTRYTPDLHFLFDEELEKQRMLDDLLDKVKSEVVDEIEIKEGL
jgi:ribosome-binding factor A